MNLRLNKSLVYVIANTVNVFISLINNVYIKIYEPIISLF